MKTLILLLSIVFLFSCSNNEQKTKYFENRYKKITQVTPYELSERFLTICENTDPNNPFHDYTPAMINNQCASFFRISSEKLTKLIIDILLYEDIIKNKNISDYDLQLKVESFGKSKNDKLRNIVIKSFDLIVVYKVEQMQLENEFTNAF